jgi:protein-S-isoprenylcysteine O-methyltransferase Ste14
VERERSERSEQRDPSECPERSERSERFESLVTRLLDFLARKRVPIGFAMAVVSLLLARPTWTAWRLGLLIAIGGECLRIWAAGHVRKGREVTRSGPYRFVRHPLYLGSAVLAVGVVVASHSVAVALLAALYMGSTLYGAIRTEEAFLRQEFGDAYELYSSSRAEPMDRAFSLARVMQNREYRAVAGLVIGFALLALKMGRPL